jgi:TetR/AcrR family transcriptional regulator, transcriptional repressor for nem operon
MDQLVAMDHACGRSAGDDFAKTQSSSLCSFDAIYRASFERVAARGIGGLAGKQPTSGRKKALDTAHTDRYGAAIPNGMEPENAMERSPSKIRLLDCALHVFRAKGYAATTVDDVCAAAGVTKGSFFHHFKGKEDLAMEAIYYWNDITGELFKQAPYRRIDDPRERLLAYIDYRALLIKGEVPDFTCLLGTLVQDVFETNPALREACDAGIRSHALDVAKMIEEAKAVHAPDAEWDAKSLGLYTQAALQGAFVLAKAKNSMKPALDGVTHLRRYIEMLLPADPVAQRSNPRTKRAQTKERRK